MLGKCVRRAKHQDRNRHLRDEAATPLGRPVSLVPSSIGKQLNANAAARTISNGWHHHADAHTSIGDSAKNTDAIMEGCREPCLSASLKVLPVGGQTAIDATGKEFTAVHKSGWENCGAAEFRSRRISPSPLPDLVVNWLGR
jgi:hypothetical protein